MGLAYRYYFFVTRHENQYLRMIPQLFGCRRRTFRNVFGTSRGFRRAGLCLQEQVLPNGRNYNHFP
ncbi:hypothetical protein ebA6957 [Aromatoleum aromaticum EbN1]|uniref:Uncharacterized protein n=1 Tax=Aromatoleum aromaticum (strain DSM 19018 / LMG 30748 / EbN1) TaxID=76114 RepID=Q5NXX8_AROAE|nr:hypothetical protein ebA6957 [Aromatoleum aromaticum EbN1]